MTPNKTGRGRPKGTGLNDAAQLRAIANLMVTHPDLKPTTAIKTLGITDPSVIRRLRDKYSAIESQLIAEVAPGLPFDVARPCEAKAREIKAAALDLPTVAPVVMQAAKSSAAADRTYCARALPLASARAELKVEPVRDALPTLPEIPAFEPEAEVSVRPKRPQHFPLPSETKLGDWMAMSLSMYALTVEAQYACLGLMFQWSPFVRRS